MTRTNRATRALQATAYHEAGHAVAAWWQQMGFREVSIVPDDEEGTLGHVLNNRLPRWFRPDIEQDCRHRTLCERRVRVLLAGLEAERRFTGRHGWRRAGADLRNAVNFLDWMSGGPEETDALLYLSKVQVSQMFENPNLWRPVEALAEMLLERRHLPGKEAQAIIRQAFMEQEVES